jgi:hypothetical protein
MSIASEITRIAGLRDTIQSKLLNFGIITDSAAKLSACSEAIDGMSLVTPSTPVTSISVTPTISAPTTAGVVTVSGSATASVKPTTAKGYTKGVGAAGTITAKTSGTKTITTQAAKIWTPTTSNQTIAAGRWLTGAQTIKGDSNLVAANIVSGKSIFGVAGSGEIFAQKVIQLSKPTPVQCNLVYTKTTSSDDDGDGTDDSEETNYYHVYRIPFTLSGIKPRYISIYRTNSTFTAIYDSTASVAICNGSTLIIGQIGYNYKYYWDNMGSSWVVSGNTYSMGAGIFSYSPTNSYWIVNVIGILT